MGPSVLVRVLWKLLATVLQQLALKNSGKQAKSIINAMYKGYISLLVAVWSLVMLCVGHVCALLPLVILNIRYAHFRPTFMGYSEGQNNLHLVFCL